MNLWEVVGLVLGSNAVIELIKVMAGRNKSKADTSTVLIDSAVDVVKLKDDLIAQLRAEFKLELEEEREKRRKLAERVDVLDGEKKTYKFRSTRSNPRMLPLSGKPGYLRTPTNDSKGKISC